MMNADGDVHVHIWLGDVTPGTHVHIHPGAPPPDEAEADDPGLPPGSGERAETEAMLVRLKQARDRRRVEVGSLQAVYDGFLGLGYAAAAAETRKAGKAAEPWINWTDPARDGQTVIRMAATRLWFIRRDDLAKADSERGRFTDDGGRTHNVRYEINAVSLQAILDAASRVKRGADAN